MTPATTITSTERLALDGPISVAVAVLVVGALLWLFAWSLRRERNIVGQRNAILFWLLRAAALGIAMWMLLGPSSVHFEQSTTRQTVAIVVDVSRSMQTVDPAGTADDFRWTMTSEATKTLPTVAADRSEAAVRMAEHRLHLATTALQNQQPERMALESAARAHDAIVRTTDGVRDVASRLRQLRSKPASEEDEQLSDQVAGIRQMLDGSEFERLARLAADFRDGRDAFATGWRESLADLEHQVRGIRRRLSTLAQRIAARDRAAFRLTAAAAESQATATRLARASEFVDTIQSDILTPLRDGGLIKPVFAVQVGS
jgi:hypothetical protein